MCDEVRRGRFEDRGRRLRVKQERPVECEEMMQFEVVRFQGRVMRRRRGVVGW